MREALESKISRGRRGGALTQLKPGVTEMIIHCGYADDELLAITRSAERRDGDRRIFSSEMMRKLLQDQNIQLISWKELHGETRSAQQESLDP